MKNRFNRFMLWMLLLPFTAHATPDISMDVFRFTTGSSPYIEVSLYVVGSTLAPDSLAGNAYGITYTLMVKNDAGQVVTGGRYKLTSTGLVPRDIMDVKRYTIEPGHYTVELEANDIHDTLGTVQIQQEIEIGSDPSSVILSDMQLLSVVRPEQASTPALNKSGLYLEPLAFRFYYPALEQLYLYHEVYHTDGLEGQPYIQYTVRPAIGDIPASIVTYKKLKKESVVPGVFQLDIKNLISGPYILEAKLFDGSKMLKGESSIQFSRLNPVGDSLYMETANLEADDAFVNDIAEDSLDYFMRAMAPIVNSLDVDVMNLLLQKGSGKAKRFFIHRYWTTTAGKNAELAFDRYMQVARVVDDNFRSGFGYGFETDRGHVFLKYGKPNDVIDVEDEPSAPPYEIWFYTTFPATHQSNVRFIFYNPSLAKNAFRLLHSTAIGEVKNELWEVELYRDATLETPKVGEKVMGENVHRNARRYFEN